MKSLATLSEERRQQQEDTIGHILGFEEPEPRRWGIQRADGLFWTGSIKGASRTYTFGDGDPMRFLTKTGAQGWIDSMTNSYSGRVAFAGCTPALIGLEPGDHVVCACGQMHEADYCPTAAGHGMVL